ncbi:hypothetical protein C0989_003512 [Termitomyces sp. Mn162]|nr:hypothetical protein C0989_003512 [Termitomyces sp. Mn162]
MFLLWGSAATLVIPIEGLSTRECQEWEIEEVQISEVERASIACADGCMLLNLSSAFFLGLGSAGRASARAPAHCDLVLGPVYFGVVLLEPCGTKDHVLLAQSDDGKDCTLHVILIMKDEVDYRADSTCFVVCSVNVEDQNGLGK